MKVLLYLLFGFVSISTFGQSCAIENTSFKVGERVDYTIYYHLAGVWVGAGEVFFKVDS